MCEESILRYSTAKGYVQSAKMIFLSPLNVGGQQVLTVLSMYMLTGFALELMFKAWLLNAGRPSEQVRAYGHRIGTLYNEALSEGLATNGGLDEVVSAIGPGHADFTYRYIEPDDRVSRLIWQNVFEVFDRLDFEVDTRIGASASKGLAPGH